LDKARVDPYKKNPNLSVQYFLKNRLYFIKWIMHAWSRDLCTRRGVLRRTDNVKRGRGRPKLTWDESVKRDLREWDISKELAVDRSVWRLAINVPEP